MVRIFLYLFIINTLLGCEKFSHLFYLRRGGIVSASSMSLKKITPLVLKPGEKGIAYGAMFGLQTQLKFGGVLIPVTQLSNDSYEFIMPTLPRAGAFKVTIGRHDDPTGTVDVSARYIISDSAGDGLPIYMASQDEICSGVAYRDADGNTQSGAKDCAVIKVPECKTTGELDCRTTATFVAAAASRLIPSNIKAGATVAGVVGTFDGTFSNCTTAGEQGCKVMGNFYAGNACTPNGSGCYLPAYTATSQPYKAIDYDFVVANTANMRTSVTEFFRIVVA